MSRQTAERRGTETQAAIVVIAFNEERRIGSCLSALLVQDTTLPYEVIVVDDGSTDETAEVVEQLRSTHTNLQLLRHDANRGRGAARRTGQDACDAPLIGFVDADIVVPPHWLRRCFEELSHADGVSGIAQPDGDCAVLWRVCQPTLRDRPGSAEITGNNVLFSRDALRRVPFSPRARLGEDFRLAKLMTRSGLQLRTVADLKVAHRETKSYGKGVWWMWQCGVDATSLLFEFRSLRLPDLASFAWLAGTVASVTLAAVGVVTPWLAGALAVALTLIVSVAFACSRFALRPHPLRFLGALALSPPLMLAYLLGRSAGLLRAPFFRHQAAPASNP